MATGNGPVSVRLNEQQLAGIGGMGARGASEALQEGLDRLIRLRTPGHLPLYPRMVDDPEVTQAIEDAVSAACDELQRLFPQGRGVEYHGISSNFQGLLIEHIKAMLTGKEAADRSWRTELNALLATDDSFGRIPYEKDGPHVGYTVAKLSEQLGQVDLFLDPDRGYCELAQLGAGGLYTTKDACVRGVLDRMARKGELPREEGVRLSAIEITDRGPLRVHAIAATRAEPGLSAAEYAEREVRRAKKFRA